MEVLTQVHSKSLLAYGEIEPKILVLSADLTNSCEAGAFAAQYKERFISGGISEQNLLSVAGGLAREEFIPLVHTFAVFIYRRAFDQVAMSAAYPNLPVKMFGFLPGITTPGGATHQAIEDLGVMRSLPNMTVLETGDATEVEGALPLACQVKGPVYVRMLRGEIPRLFPKDEPLRLDTPRILSRGNDLTVFSSGICTEEAMRAGAALKRKGISIQHVHISTLKPFNSPRLKEILSKPVKGIITMENHSVIGGLGTVIAEKMVELGINNKLVKLGLQDTFAHGGSRLYLMKKYGIDAMALVSKAEEIIGQDLHLTEEDLSKARTESAHSPARPEAM